MGVGTGISRVTILSARADRQPLGAECPSWCGGNHLA